MPSRLTWPTEGDGKCMPSAADCQKIELRVGETEFLTVAADTTAGAVSTSSSQFELDLVRIAGAGKKKAGAARAGGARTARAGRTVARVVRLLHP